MNLYGETFAKFYDRHFGIYAENVAPLLLHFFSSQPTAFSRLPILDLGCGTGHLAFHFLEAGYGFVGLDLSPYMLLMAENRCWRYVAGHKCRFLQEDITRFQVGGAFSMAMSTYNVLNHLDSEEKLRGCFRSVRGCLAAGAPFVFDFHTLIGLREWASAESVRWEDEEVVSQGEFDCVKGKAVMNVKGRVADGLFDETIVNHSYPLAKLAQWLDEEGFRDVRFSRMDDLQSPLEDPEKENRVVVIAG
jgi:SAM-dependent methyltransferase